MRKIFIIVPFLLLLLSACNTQEKILKSKDVNYKLTAANQYYDAGKWAKANTIYESLIPVFRGTKNYEELYYRYCYTFYNMKDYLSASYQFKNFVEAFPGSTRADECEFMYATCMFKQSPRYPLDQSTTQKAMEVLQSYINSHPDSKNLTQANNYIDICRAKIEMKDARAARLYYDMQQYKAAGVAYKSLMQAYPESKDIDFYQFMVEKSYYKYAHSSIRTKQEERFAEAVNAYNDLKEYYPHSAYLKEAADYQTSAQNIINQLRNEHK